MPEVLDKPKVDSADEYYDPSASPESPPDEGPTVLAEEAVPPATPPAAAPAAAVPAQAPAHPPSLVEQAVFLQIPSAEIEEMSTKELERAVKSADRAARYAWETAQQQAKQPEAKPDEEEIVLDFGKDEYGNPLSAEDVNPAMLNGMKGIVKQFNAKLKEAKSAIEQQSVVRDVEARIDGVLKTIGADTAFDRSTKAGQANRMELLGTMAGISHAAQQAGKRYDEPELVRRAVKAMDLEPKAAPAPKPEDAELEKRKKAFEEGALAGAGTRASNDSVYERVRKILAQDKKRRIAEPEPETEWN